MRKVVEFLSVVVVDIILFKALMILIKLDTPEILIWTITAILGVFIGLSIVWLFSSDKVRETLLSPRKIIIQLKKNKTSVLLFIGVIVGVYPLGYYLMSWLLYSLLETHPFIALIGLVLYPIVYIVYLLIYFSVTGADFEIGGKALQRALKICPHCLKKIPSIFTSKCPHCTAEL